MLGQELPWLPISLSPFDTRAGLLWTIPALAVLLGIVKLGGYKATWLGWVTVSVMLFSVAVGAAQRAGGNWHFYEITNFGVATGFFANANHQATLLLATIPFLAGLYLAARERGQSAQRTSGFLVILVGLFIVLLVGLAINGSLAGIGLAAPVVGASALMLWSRKRKVPRWALLAAVIAVAGAAYLPFSAPIGSNNLTSSEARSSQFSRYTTFSRTIEAAKDHLPVGSGIGTFVEIYRTYEDPATVEATYINRAHSDYLEFFLETGFIGVLIVALFLLWWVRRLLAVWWTDKPDHLARAASIASTAILMHSIVDYPLRTAAIGAVFALCCALMAEPRPRAARSAEAEGAGKARHLSAD
jgi:O-antigen ligase